MTSVATPGTGSPVPASQATAIEQTRATTEVLGAIEAAQRWPRDTQKAIRDVVAACGMLVVAETALYEYRRGTDIITGPTVELARTIALCWQHIHYGIRVLSRDDEAGTSEILTYAWDVQTGVRADRIFILPMRRYITKKGTAPVRLVDERDVQENNISVGGRNVREAIYAVLPPFLRHLALQECHTTLTEGPRDDHGARVALPALDLRIRDCLERYAALGVTEHHLTHRLRRGANRWSTGDLARLGTLWRSLEQGITTVAAEFSDQSSTGVPISTATASSWSPDTGPIPSYSMGVPVDGGSQPPTETPDTPGTGGA